MPSRVRASARASKSARNKPATALPRLQKTWRRITYTPEGLAELRRLYEETPQSDVAVAKSYGISAPTLRAKAKEQGWTKYKPTPIDIPPAVRLAAEAARLVQQRARIANSAAATPTRPAAQADLPLAGGGEEEGFAAQAGRGETTDLLPAFRATVEAAIAEANRQIAALKVAREQMQESGEYGRATQLGRDLSHISMSLHRLGIILRGGALEQDQFDDDSDDFPDLDALRDELARRIDALVDEWLHAPDAEQSGRAGALPSDV